MKGLAIGDGLCDPPHQLDYGDFLYQVGLLDESDRNLVELRSEMAKISMKNQQWHLASNVRRFFSLFASSFFFRLFCELSDVAKPLLRNEIRSILNFFTRKLIYLHRKNFVKSTTYLIKYLSSNFFSETVIFTKFLLKLRVNFRNFHNHNVEFTKLLYHGFLKNFCENNLFSEEFCCKIDFTK